MACVEQLKLVFSFRMDTPIAKAINFAGSQTALARLLNVAPQAVQQWASRGRIPLDRALAIEKVTEGAVTAIEILESHRAMAA